MRGKTDGASVGALQRRGRFRIGRGGVKRGLAGGGKIGQRARMAWRIDEALVRGEIDNRVRGRVTGRLWFAGRAEPVTLELAGNAWRDVAGQVLRFTNPEPKPGELNGLAAVQRGVAGDITASRRVKVPACPREEFTAHIAARREFPWRWGNCLYLEWHSVSNGRVVIESAGYALEMDGEPAWTMSAEEERIGRAENERTVAAFWRDLAGTIEKGREKSDTQGDGAGGGDEADRPTTRAEAWADAEDARMEELNERVARRLEEGGIDAESFSRIWTEERERLRRERGEPEEPPPGPELEAERAEWTEEMNAAATEAQEDWAAEKWKRGEDAEGGESWGDDGDEWHPLVERCTELGERLRKEGLAAGWLGDEEAGADDPLWRVVAGVTTAAAKLAGALGTREDAEDWPPEASFAGSVLVRLKKARRALRGAAAGLDASRTDLAEACGWVRGELAEIGEALDELIAEVRAVLRAAESDDRAE